RSSSASSTATALTPSAGSTRSRSPRGAAPPAGNPRWFPRVDRGKVTGGWQATRGRLTTKQGGERFRLRESIQEKRAEGDGGDLVNNATVNYKCQLKE